MVISSIGLEIFGLRCLFFSAIWCLTLDPYPTVNVTRYNSQSFNCSVDPNWNSVSYNYRKTNIALFYVQGGKCQNFAATVPGLYKTDCDDSTSTFYLTINNVTDGKPLQCVVTYSTGATSSKTSTINVQCK